MAEAGAGPAPPAEGLDPPFSVNVTAGGSFQNRRCLHFLPRPLPEYLKDKHADQSSSVGRF